MMNHRVLLLAAALACSPANAALPSSPPGYPSLTVVASGDTATISGTWSAGRGATGYLVTVISSRTSGIWTYVPAAVGTSVGAATTARLLTIKGINTTADSADFVLCVRGTQGTRQAATATCSSARQWLRLPSSPDTVRIDTIAMLQGLEVYPVTASIAIGAQTQICAYYRFTSGRVAMRPVDVQCTSDYNSRFTLAQRSLTQTEQNWISCAGSYAFDPGCQAGAGSRLLRLERRAD